MRTDKNLWRTADGKLVETGHPDARVLAYAAGDEVPDDVAAELKQAAKPANKAQRKPADKAAPKPNDK